MGYDIHITRKDDWADDDGPVIEHDEWLSYLSIDKSMALDQDREAERDSAVATGAKSASLAVWKDWPSSDGDTVAEIWHSQGNLIAVDPDIAFRQKMFLIADALGAKVQGSKGEIYNSIGDPEKRPRRSGSRAEKPWWKVW